VNEKNRAQFRKRCVALAVASCLSLSPWVAEAAGLGKLTVFSGLGQPLRAELEVTANADELNGMTARLAPREVFQQAGVDFPAALNDLRFTVDKAQGGRSIVKLSSVRPINEPFLDFLIEINWPAGRLVREYTFLLDPPEFANRQTAPAVADSKLVNAPVTADKPYTLAPTPGPVVKAAPAATALPAARSTPASPAPVAERKPPAPASPPPAQPETASHLVTKGENLRKIAGEHQYDGVSLEQMLVGLYRENPDAFIGKDIHRLKAGAILNLPAREKVESVSSGEAKRVYLASGNFDAYRRKLASAAAQAPVGDGPEASQSSSGRISPKIDDKATAQDAARDQVKVARTDSVDRAAKAAASEADRLAQAQALKEAETRVGQLEKNVEELQKLLRLKNQALADLQKPAVSSAPAPAALPVAVEKPADVTPPVEKPVAAPPAPAPSEAPVPAEPVVPPPQPVPVAPAPVKPVPPPPPPEPVVEEPSLVDFLIEDPLPLAGGAGVLALLGGALLYRRRRQQRAGESLTTAIPSQSSIGPNSVFGTVGGQSVDTGSIALPTGEFSQAGPGVIDTDEVDPVAEADVYMAYGRDAQAEEILLEAMQKDPQRLAIHVKLLEIYGNRRSMKQFETLASELYALTGGKGPEWAQVAKLGVAIDPGNPIYGGEQTAAANKSFDADATMVVSPAAFAASHEALATAVQPEPVSASEAGRADDEVIAESSPEIDFEHSTVVLPEQDPVPPSATDDAAFDFDEASLDFDLGAATDEDMTLVIPAESPQSMALSADDNALDFDLDGLTSVVPPTMPRSTDSVPAQPAEEDDELDFSHTGTLVMPESLSESAIAGFSVDALDLDQDQFSPPPAVSAPVVPEMPGDLAPTTPADQPVLAEEGLDFDVNLSDSAFLGQSPALPDFDMSAINLDLTADESTAEPQGEAAALAAAMADPAGGADEMTMDDWLASEAAELAPPPVADTEPTPLPDLALSADLPLAAEPAALPDPEPSAPAKGPVVHDEHWEEVNTKLDLARAYEEMGDLEGARELLQEVQSEGTDDLVALAGEMMERIGH